LRRIDGLQRLLYLLLDCYLNGNTGKDHRIGELLSMKSSSRISKEQVRFQRALAKVSLADRMPPLLWRDGE